MRLPGSRPHTSTMCYFVSSSIHMSCKIAPTSHPSIPTSSCCRNVISLLQWTSSTLQQQTIIAVDDACLTALCDHQTKTIYITIAALLDYLFSNHGQVTPAMIQHEEKNVKEILFDPTHLVDVIFNNVKDLSNL